MASAFSAAAVAEQPGYDTVTGTSFLRLQHLSHLIPAFATAMFSEISEHDCRVDVSSSQLRAAAAAGSDKQLT